MNCSSREAGFTLLELMVAMALSVVIAMISAMALGSGADFYARNALRQTKSSEFKILENTLRPEWQLRVNAFKLTDRSIEFVTTQPRESDLVSNVLRVNYECSLNKQLGYSLLHTSIELPPPPKTEVSAPVKNPQEQYRIQTVLLDNLKTCGFAALKKGDGGKDKAPMQWVSQWGVDDPVPKLIRFQVSDFRGELPNYVFVAETL
ncbi:MAG: hypothetical protein CFE43_06950 [Burkholderiales bacterium PBB3]|nr:MAG: hypothetical protein CFE43_06950 [Burkholderiales bacterium PBB3]